MRLKREVVARIALGAGALLSFSLFTIYLLLLQTVPARHGAMRIEGLQRPVEIVRDGNGVPHMLAGTMSDAMTALGFAHAQDRLWQMESARLVVQGRLAEVIGASMVETDVLMRTLDLDGHAKRAFSALPAEARAKLDAYARGVNAFLDRETGLVEPRLPPEMLLLGHRPEPWRGADSLGVIKLLALTLSNNLGHEIRRLRLAALGLSPTEIADLLPVAEANGAPPLPDLRQLLPLQRIAAGSGPTRTALVDGMMGSGASNNWVLSGQRTVSGKPLLANDPHLRLQVPSTWYFAHMSVREEGKPAFDVVGASLAGAPLIVLGRSGSLAWGFTNTGADVQDLFIERVNPDNPAEYLTPQGWQRFREEPFTVRVRGGGERRFVRRSTRHGPVLPEAWRDLDKLLRPGHVAALAWTALADDDSTIAAGLGADEVNTVEQFIERQRLYVVPMQSMVVADASGTIALIAPGRVPIRSSDNHVMGRAPVPGWDAPYDWQGTIPFDELPRRVDPPGGAIATANARIVSPEYRPHLTYDWETQWRQQRIEQLLALRERHSVADMRGAQLDAVSLPTIQLKTLLIDAARPYAPNEGLILDQLAAWNGEMAAERPEPLIFEAWLRESVRGLIEDDLGELFDRFWEPNADFVISVLEGKARGRDWCDDRRTYETETCGEVVARALTRSLASLTWQHGARRDAWRWGDVHVADADHRLFGAIPGLGLLTSIRLSTSGGAYTLNRGSTDYAAPQPFANTNAASMRAIYDFADLERSLFIHSTGQSGNPLSPHYADFAKLWARGEYIEIATDRARVMERASGVWRLESGTRR